MVAIEASEEEIAKELLEGLSIAGINAPDSVVVSGSEAAALKLAETWKDKGRKTTRLRVSHAFHSELMEPMLDEFAAVAQTISYNPPKIPVLSNLSGEPLTPEQATDPAYWVAQVQRTGPLRRRRGAPRRARSEHRPGARPRRRPLRDGPGLLRRGREGRGGGAIAAQGPGRGHRHARRPRRRPGKRRAVGLVPTPATRLPRPASHLRLPAQALLAGTAGGGGRRPRRRAGQRRSSPAGRCHLPARRRRRRRRRRLAAHRPPLIADPPLAGRPRRPRHPDPARHRLRRDGAEGGRAVRGRPESRS